MTIHDSNPNALALADGTVLVEGSGGNTGGSAGRFCDDIDAFGTYTATIETVGGKRVWRFTKNATGGSSWSRWEWSGASTTVTAVEFSMGPTPFPTGADNVLVGVRNSNNTYAARIEHNQNGTISWHDAGNVARWTSSITLPTTAGCRIAMTLTQSTTAAVVYVAIYTQTDGEGTTVADSYSNSARDTGAFAFTEVWFGNVNSTGVASYDFRYLRWDDASSNVIGPLVAGGGTPGQVYAATAEAGTQLVGPIVVGERLLSSGGPAAAAAQGIPPTLGSGNATVLAVPATATATAHPIATFGGQNIMPPPATALARGWPPLSVNQGAVVQGVAATAVASAVSPAFPSQNFSYTGAQQTYVVPSSVNYVDIDLRGAQGGKNGATEGTTPKGGRGARIRSAHQVTPGETLYVYVGQTPSAQAGGWNGGGNGWAGGGGATDVRRGGTAVGNRIVSAGGGGGAGFYDDVTKGMGGYAGVTAGRNGYSGPPTGTTGKGGSQTAGGVAGTYNSTQGTPTAPGTGTVSDGGAGGGTLGILYGGGGGGGWYGGGGGGFQETGAGVLTDGGHGGGGGASKTAGRLLESAADYQTGSGIAILTPYITPRPTVTSPPANTSSATGVATFSYPTPHVLESGIRTLKVQISPTPTFSSGIIETTYTLSQSAVAGTHNMPVATGQGLYYMRARMEGDNSLPYSAWTDATAYTVSHKPSVTVASYVGGAHLEWNGGEPYFAFNWLDSWASDTLTAYQIEIQRNDNGNVVYDSGKTSYTGVQGTLTVHPAVLDSQYKDVQLRWRVKVWDTTNTESNYSSWGVFTLTDPPSVTITNPTSGGTVTSGAPTFTWTVDFTVERYPNVTSVEIFDSNGESVWSVILSGAIYYATPLSNILANGETYDIVVSVIDQVGLEDTVTHSFDVSYVTPASVDYFADVSQINQNGYVTIDWSATNPDDTFASWRIYRRELPSITWVLLSEITGELTNSYTDWLVKSNSTYQYCVTQTAERSGDLIESPIGLRYVSSSDVTIAEDRPILVEVENYWIIAPSSPSLSIKLENVVGDGVTDEYEMESYGLAGRGRHVDYGDRLGYSGALIVHVRKVEAPSTVRRAVETLRKAALTYYIRTPFGQLFPAALGSPQWDPIPGTGKNEMGDLTIPYLEVG